MTKRQRTTTTSSWAAAAVLVAMMASSSPDNGGACRAFSSSSLPSAGTGTGRASPTAGRARAATRGSPSASVARGRRRHPTASTTTTTTLHALLPAPASLVAGFAPPVASSVGAAAASLSAASAAAAMIAGGIFAGSLHAIAGPDHLAALVPRCCGLPWHRAARVGAVWGMGHGVSATMLGMAGYLFKRGVSFGMKGSGNRFDVLHHVGSFMELAIGVSLIVIGLLGIKEAREWESPAEAACDVPIGEEGGGGDDKEAVKSKKGGGVPQSLSSAAAPPYSSAAMAMNPNPAKRAVLFNGILHGFSWDGAPSLAPAVAVSTWRGSLTFLLSYALGTMAAMTLATTVIGEGTRRAAGKLERPDLPRDLSVVSSFLALIVGVVWCGLALR